MNVLLRPVRTSIGLKYVTAVTGLALIGFVLGHMGGNLLIFLGRDWINGYAQHLQESGPFLWAARGGLLAVFLLHTYLGVRLARGNRAARPQRYVFRDTVQASTASRFMLWTGLVLLTFTLYHLAHFTFGVLHAADVGGTENVPYRALRDAQGRHDVYAMVVYGFRKPVVSAVYVLAMAFLAMHLWHGGSSWLQTFGWTAPRYRPLVWAVGPVLAVVVFLGNCSIPLAVLTRLVGADVPEGRPWGL